MSTDNLSIQQNKSIDRKNSFDTRESSKSETDSTKNVTEPKQLFGKLQEIRKNKANSELLNIISNFITKGSGVLKETPNFIKAQKEGRSSTWEERGKDAINVVKTWYFGCKCGIVFLVCALTSPILYSGKFLYDALCSSTLTAVNKNIETIKATLSGMYGKSGLPTVLVMSQGEKTKLTAKVCDNVFTAENISIDAANKQITFSYKEGSKTRWLKATFTSLTENLANKNFSSLERYIEQAIAADCINSLDACKTYQPFGSSLTAQNKA